MDKSFKCECGNEDFWYFGKFVRCPKCLNEYKCESIYHAPSYRLQSSGFTTTEYWMRRFNKETNQYDKNWEQTPMEIKK